MQIANVNIWAQKSIEEIFDELKTSERGLTKKDVESKIRIFGTNEVEMEDKFKVFFRFFKKHLHDPLSLILLGSGIIIYIIGQHIDAYIIFATYIANTSINIFQIGRAKKTFEKLKAIDQVYTPVKRDGEIVELNINTLVPGDIVLLQPGSKVPADVRLIEENELLVNESVLTGEWQPVTKKVVTLMGIRHINEQVNMVWRGTTIVAGNGYGIVVNTGEDTRIGGLAVHLRDDEITPLKKQINTIAKLILAMVFAAVGIIALIAALKDFAVADIFLLSVSIAIAGAPSGLPAAITVVLVVGMTSLLKKNGLAKNLLAVETLGGVTWVLTDKTGTLTKGMMELNEILHASGRETIGTENVSNFSRQIIQDTFVATNGERIKKEGSNVLSGTSIEQAVYQVCMNTCFNKKIRDNRIDYLPFISKNKYSSALIETISGDKEYHIVGAPETILELSENVEINGRVQVLTKAKKKELHKLFEVEAANGKRVLAVASSYKPSLDLDANSQELTFRAFLSFLDVVREDVPESIQFIKDANVNITMVTGDNEETALFIAKQSGIVTDANVEEVILGGDLPKYTDEELLTKLKYVKVFARMLPEQKLRLLKLLQNHGERVAMTGDGVNDAPALYRAAIGIAVESGTDVAKEAADLILLKNSFSTITNAIIQGRKIVTNLKKIIIYLLSTSFSEAILIGGGLLFAPFLPITPVQILWANIIEEMFISFAFAFEKEDPDTKMKNPRNERTFNVISKNVKESIIVLSLSIGLFLLVVFLLLTQFTDFTEQQIQTIMFIVISVDSMMLVFSLKSLNRSILKTNIFDNKLLIYSLLFSSSLLVLAFVFEPLRNILGVVYIPWEGFLIIPVTAAYHVFFTENVKKYIFIKDYSGKVA